MARNRNNVTGKNEIAPVCPVHKLVGQQTFSIDEMEFLVLKKNVFKICESCAFKLEKEIHRFQNREITC